MCGIAGLIDFTDGQLPEPPGKVLRIMLDRLRHRGPDDRGEERLEHEDGPTVYLGHQRLSIIDLSSNGHQPMANESHSIWISTNSEIYNYRELREELRAKNHHFFSNSDTEVLLKAYEEWGVDCLEKLRGMFAFGIWDSRTRVLFLARDRLGIKPLYYYSSPECFLFASEVRALASTGFIDLTVNETGLFHFLTFGSVSGPDTFWKTIKELPPAHYMLVSPESVTQQRYWDPLQISKNSGLDFPSDSKKELVAETLKESVRVRQVSDVSLGAFLSGGIDSSAVVALMDQKTDRPVETLSVVFRESEFDESRYSNEVAEQMGTQHHTLELDESALIDALSQAIGAMDQPTVDGINTFLISKCARETGWKVAISGIGGDELFGGYDSFRLVPRLLGLEKVLGVLPSSWLRSAGAWLKRHLPASDANIKLGHFVSGQKSGSHPYYLMRTLFCEDQVNDLFTDKIHAAGEKQKHLERTQTLTESLSAIDPLKQVSFLELTHYLPNTLLRDADMMSMAHGLEIRVPLIDHRLVELMFSLAAKIQFARPPAKSLLVDSLPVKLSSQLVQRKKMGFTLPFENWMRNDLKTEVESVLLNPVPTLSDFISETAVAGVWRGFLNGQVSWSRPWALYILKKWFLLNSPNSTEKKSL
ncbi:MAG: asparagine synthetase B [Nitrospinaceae bacterium]|nr:MAG: asparagine synthetase B [Nitrospinaceae bacterium]